MQERLQAQLAELQQELATGQEHLRELQEKQARLQQTVLRISGAVQVLEELLAGVDPPSPVGGHISASAGDEPANRGAV